MANPDRGEVWLVDLGHAAKTRPCLVLSNPALDTDRALTTVILPSRAKSKTPFATGSDFMRDRTPNEQRIRLNQCP